MKISHLLSGGVDSSVALILLKKKYPQADITAYYLKIWLEDELDYLGNCPWEEDLGFARKVCKLAKVPLKIINFQKEYHQSVVKYTIAEAKAGRTPNPDMMCNSLIKFGAFFEAIDKDSLVSTGHYADVKKVGKLTYLVRVKDPIKDQTYFLANLRQDQVARSIFPVGKYLKSEVRTLARRFNLPNKDRKDSQGLCFLGKIPYDEYLEKYLQRKPGDIINFHTGEKLGIHRGHYFYTFGQRKHLGLRNGPWYVVQKDTKKNLVYVSNTYDQAKEERSHFYVTKPNWIAKKPAFKNLLVKIRHGPYLHACSIKQIKKNVLEIRLKKPDQGIAPGQFAVFYDKKYCYGCGVITKSFIK